MPILLVVLVVLLLITWGFYFRFFRRSLDYFFPNVKKCWKNMGSGLMALVMSAWSLNIRGIGIVVLLYMVIYGIGLDVLMWLGGFMRRFREKSADSVAEKPLAIIFCRLNRSGILVVIFTVLTIAYGYYNMAHVCETRYEVTTDQLAPGETLTVTMISDLHLGMNMDAEELKGHLDVIGQAKPDLFLLVGDLFDEGTTRKNMLQAAAYLGGVETTYGIYYVYGNHDVNQYREDKAYTPEEMTSALRAAGIQVLVDEAVEISHETSTMHIIGRLDRSFGIRASVAELTAGLPEDSLKILLDHQPAEMAEKAACGIDLQVSGHTHAGQVWPFGQFSEITGFNEINYGLSEYGEMTAIVSSGIAGWGFPVRTAEHCEYVIIELQGE